MKTLKGTSIAPGIVQGTVCLYSNKAESKVPHYTITASQVKNEIKRLDQAFKRAQDEMGQMIKVAEKQLDKQAAEIFNTHLLILQDKGLYEKIVNLIKTKNMNAEHSISDIFSEYMKKYDAAGGHFKELSHDLIDTRDRIINAFSGEKGHFKCPRGEQMPVIVAATHLTPSMVLGINRDHVLAFVVAEGGFTSHATILARSYGVPMVFGINVTNELDCGMNAIVNGSQGSVVVSPDKKTEDYYQRKIENLKKKKLVCSTAGEEIVSYAKTKDNISLKINISVPEDLEIAKDLHYDGVGLLRTEFLFINEQKPPSENYQYEMYRQLFEDARGAVTVRILDLSSDKLPPYLKLPADSDRESSPSSTESLKGLGEIDIRGAIAVEIFEDFYIKQFKALLRANERLNMRFLYPMVSDLNDLNTFKSTLAKAKNILRKEKVTFYDQDIKEGVMIETPAAVMLSQEILKQVDFVNIGSNDLLQYTVASSRSSSMAEKRYHILHPALVKMLEIVVSEGKKAKKEVCLCGEVASFEDYYPLLLNIGIRSFSISPSKFNDIQCELFHIKASFNRQFLSEFYNLASKKDVEDYFASHETPIRNLK